MTKTFIAQVHIVIEADSYAEACDAISAALTENLQYGGAILDWAYTQRVDEHGDVDGTHTGPRESCITPAEFVEDGCGAALDVMFAEATETPDPLLSVAA